MLWALTCPVPHSGDLSFWYNGGRQILPRSKSPAIHCFPTGWPNVPLHSSANRVSLISIIVFFMHFTRVFHLIEWVEFFKSISRFLSLDQEKFSIITGIAIFSEVFVSRNIHKSNESCRFAADANILTTTVGKPTEGSTSGRRKRPNYHSTQFLDFRN